MDECREVLTGNMVRLRQAAGLTQAELGEKLNYSDKSVSKWERGDALPDVFVLRQLAEIYGVSIDDLLTDHSEAPAPDSRTPGYSTTVITIVSILGVWTLALMVFVAFWISGTILWQVFLYAIPLSLVALLVLHTLWQGGKRNQHIVAALVLSLIAAVYFTLLPLLPRNPWQIFLLLIPAELVVYFSFRIRGGAPDKPENDPK